MERENVFGANKSSNKTPEQTHEYFFSSTTNGAIIFKFHEKFLARVCHKYKSSLKLKRQLMLTHTHTI